MIGGVTIHWYASGKTPSIHKNNQGSIPGYNANGKGLVLVCYYLLGKKKHYDWGEIMAQS